MKRTVSVWCAMSAFRSSGEPFIMSRVTSVRSCLNTLKRGELGGSRRRLAATTYSFLRMAGVSLGVPIKSTNFPMPVVLPFILKICSDTLLARASKSPWAVVRAVMWRERGRTHTRVSRDP